MSENIKNFICLGKNCPKHCCGSFNGISDSLRPMCGIEFSEIILLPEDVRKLQEAGYNNLIKQASNGMMIINTDEDGTCGALKDGICQIYNVRPAICRAYPLYLDMFAGVCVATECKAIGENITVDQCEGALEALLKIYQYWIDYCKEANSRSNEIAK